MRFAFRSVDAPDGDLIDPSLRAALAMTGSMSVIPCMPPGELCELRGGVFVRPINPRQRIAGGW